MLHIHPVHAFKDNYIWVVHNQRYAVVVDPGEALPVLQFLENSNLQLIAILITHHHYDHVGGNIDLLKQYTVPVYGPKNESITTLTHQLKEGNRVQLPELPLEFVVLATPGHTNDHIVYYAPRKNASDLLFCGDTLFSCGCGRIFEGTAHQMYTSLQKLASLPDETSIYCAHEYTLGNVQFARTIEPENEELYRYEMYVHKQLQECLPTLPSVISTEKKINPFLRCHQPDVIHSANVYSDKKLPDPISVFSELRNWKNTV